MRHWLDAACGCNKGRVRRNNEDNFFFDGKCLEQENQGLRNTACFSDTLKNGVYVAVFDGMGGEHYGEVAAFTAARQIQAADKAFSDFFVSERKYLLKLTTQLNAAIVEAKQALCVERCGCTVAALYFSSGYVYTCNVGDSRTYRLRDGAFQQLSVDHVENGQEGRRGKAPLTQYLGIEPEEMLVEPYIAKGKVNKGDVYLVCSDGLTDMLTNVEICDILLSVQEPSDCVEQLIQSALDNGGRDNVTVIVCRID